MCHNASTCKAILVEYSKKVFKILDSERNFRVNNTCKLLYYGKRVFKSILYYIWQQLCTFVHKVSLIVLQ